MKFTSSLSVALCALTLAACGGGGGGSNTPASTTGTNTTTTTTSQQASRVSTSAPSSTTQVIEYYGDSTIWGWPTQSNGATRVAKTAPQAFAEQLPAAARYDVRNEGVSGTTACQLLAGTDGGGHQRWEDQMTASPAKYVIINHGINDSAPAQNESVNAYRTCLTSLVQIATTKGKRVILETPNPIDAAAQLEPYVTAMRQIASALQVPLIDQYTMLQNYIAQPGGPTTVADIVPDGLHPIDSVYVMKGQYAAQQFLTLSY